jgi:CTP synthase (UTP-ammonia lyase)
MLRYARNVLGVAKANSAEFQDPADDANAVIVFMPEIECVVARVSV